MAITKSPKGKAKAGRKVASRKTRAAIKKPVRKASEVMSPNGRKAAVGFVPTKLKLRRPVPSDIDIAQEAKLKPILQVAAELGIRPD